MLLEQAGCSWSVCPEVLPVSGKLASQRRRIADRADGGKGARRSQRRIVSKAMSKYHPSVRH